MSQSGASLETSSVVWRRLGKVWHVGTLVSADKGSDSQEGNGLSVSTVPREWAEIARLGDQVFTLTRKGGRFLDAHRLSKLQRQALLDWGLAQGFLENRPLWRVSWTDGESGEEVFTVFEDEAAARRETGLLQDDDTQTLEPECVIQPVLTERSRQRLGFALDPLLAEDIVMTFWVEDCTDADGVWWQDRLDPSALSAPRGVINLRQLGRWAVSGPVRLD